MMRPPTGVAAEIELTISAKCQSKSTGINVWFSKNRRAKLYEKDQRMAFVNLAAARFNALLKGNNRAGIEASISEIAKSGGRQ